MATITRTGPHTFADFMELIREDQKADLLDGVIYMASPENLDHNDVVSWMDRLIGLFLEKRPLGRLTVNRVAYRLSDKTGPEPDLAFVRNERLSILRKGYVDGPPDLAIEVVSPDSADRDYENKRNRYEQAGVQEYWIIDPDERRATFLILHDRRFAEHNPVGGVFESQVLKGFKLDVGWLWQRPLPATLPIVQSFTGP